MAIERSGTKATTARTRPPMHTSLHDIDDLYENNAFQDDDEEGDPPSTHNSRKRPTSTGDSPADGNAKASTNKTSAGKVTKLEFNVWVARKDKYERAAQALGNLNTDRATDDTTWLALAVSLAATDVLIKTGKTDQCDCAGVCRDPSHSVTKQRTRCQCPVKKCSLCKRCIGTTPGEITDKMINSLAPYKLTPPLSVLALAERIVTAGDGKPLVPGGPKVTTGVIRMAQAVLSQCSVLANDDGTRIQRPCTCPVRSLGDLWVKWTTKYHTFSRIPLTAADAAKFSSGTRQMMECDDETSTYYMTLKWHQAAKPQKGDTAKIAARRMLTPDQKKQNAFFLGLCKKAWHQAQLQVVEQLQLKMTAFYNVPLEKRKCLPEEYELSVLNTLGVKRLMAWIEEDAEAIEDAKKDETKDKTDGGVMAHNAWVKRKDRLRIRMPVADSVVKPGGTWKPPRMDFSSGKGVVRPTNHKLPSSTVEMMKDSGLKYVHAMNEGFQGRGGDLEKCQHLLLKKGHVFKANFDLKATRDDDGDDAPFSKDRYYFEKQHNPARKKKKETAAQRVEQSKAQYAQWVAHKALKEKAAKYLTHIPKPQREAGSYGDLETYENEDDEAEVPGRVRWQEVGKALKAVDRSLLEDWIKWSDGFASVSHCRLLWESFAPIACDVHGTSSAIRDVFLKLLHRTGVNYKQAFLSHCDKKHKKLLALGIDDDLPDELTDDEKMTKFAQLDKREFAKLLVDLGIVLQPEELQRLVEYFDADGNQHVSIQEFLEVVGDKRSRGQCHGDTDLVLQHVCMWETVCHECGMLHAFQLVVGSTKPGASRMRAELPGHIKRRGRFKCRPECDMHVLKKEAPTQCAFSQWRDEQATPFLKKLELWSAQTREQHVLQKLVTDGQPPDAPLLFREDDDALDPTTSVLLRWQPPPVRGNNGAAFYILETIGAEGTTSFRLNEYKEVYRDPRDFKDNGGQPRYNYVASNLVPNTKYGFRIRALNGFGAGPYTFAYVVTAPATPPAPLAISVTASAIQLGWESSSYYRRQLRQLRQVFEEADADHNGAISRDEFMDEIERRKPKLLEFLQKISVPASVLPESNYGGGAVPVLSVFDAIETDDNESISWDEFMRFFHGFLDDPVDLEGSVSSKTSRKTSSTTSKSTKRPGSDVVKIASCRYVLKQCTNEATGEYVEIYRGQKASFTVHGLASGSTYQFRVQALNDDGQASRHSDAVVVNTLLQTPSTPVLVESACTATCVKLKWPVASARPCLSHEAIQSRSKMTTVRKGASNGDAVTRILKEWANETSVDDGAIDFRAKFDRYDIDKSEFIELPEFKTLLEELGVAVTPERMAAYMEEFDADHDGKVSYAEFCQWWTKTEVQYVLKRNRSGVEKGDNMSVVCYRGKDTATLIGGLAPNTEYHFRLRTVSSHASSQLSEAVVVCTPPQAPSGAGMISVVATGAQICWYAGINGAYRFMVECKLVETLSSTDGASAVRRLPSSVGATGEWVRVYEGSDTLATMSNLVPSTVYRLRVFAVNRTGLISDQSTVTQFCTLTRDEERKRGVANLKPSTAADHFVVECTDDGDVVSGDTILFSERLVRSETGKVSGESELVRAVPTDKLATSSVYSTASYSSQANGGSNGAEPIGERTVAARVVSVRTHERHGNIVSMVVVWSTVQLYDDAVGTRNKRTAARPPSQMAKRSAAMNSSIHTTSHALSLGAGYALAADLKIARRERALYKYEVFRREWQDEQARDPRTWAK